MTTLAVRPTDISAILASLRLAESIEDLQEARARIEAARAWAKVHGQVKAMRLDLLRVEVEALVRIAELGGANLLPPKDRKAAKWLSDMSPEERAALVSDSGNATTAAGMCRSIWTAEELETERELNRQRGRRFATTPGRPEQADLIRLAREHVANVSAVLSDVVDTYTDTAGRAFTVNELADEVIADAALGDLDPAVREGVREVCRTALRRSPIVEIDGTRLPRTVTARDEDGNFIRIPVENALLAHLAEMRDLRREQLAQDQAALDVLDDIDARLRAIPGATDRSRIGDLIARSLARKAAS